MHGWDEGGGGGGGGLEEIFMFPFEVSKTSERPFSQSVSTYLAANCRSNIFVFNRMSRDLMKL